MNGSVAVVDFGGFFVLDFMREYKKPTGKKAGGLVGLASQGRTYLTDWLFSVGIVVPSV
jgi:hypothetical protein